MAGCGSEESKQPAAQGTQPVSQTEAAGSEASSSEAQTVRGEVTLYTSADQRFAETIIAEFTRRTNIRVKTKFDTEADKNTGLARRIRAESSHNRSQADVFWANEPFQMILLARDGLLETYVPETAKDIPVAYRDAKDQWTGFAMRARVLAYNPQMLESASLPKSWKDLAEAPHAAKVILANPVFGTTRGHVAAMLSMWGEAEFTAWVDKLAAAGLVSRMAAGNAHAARQVAEGTHPMCGTDTDDVYVLQRSGRKIEMVYPDMGAGGTLLLPNTVGLIKNGPNPEPARELVAFLCSAYVEEALAKSDSGNFPVRPAVREKLGMTLPPISPVDYVKVAEAMPRAIEIVQQRWR